jgi:hypothetical protein
MAYDQHTADVERELAAIRGICERHLTANPDDTTVDLVYRMAHLAMPELYRAVPVEEGDR